MATGSVIAASALTRASSLHEHNAALRQDQPTTHKPWSLHAGVSRSLAVSLQSQAGYDVHSCLQTTLPA